jgi:hypothetical protein
LNDRGVFSQEIPLSSGNHNSSDLIVVATFLPNECEQNSSVLKIVGNHGQYLGHDDHIVTMDEASKGETRGMLENPQIIQVSGWYFGISAITRAY